MQIPRRKSEEMKKRDNGPIFLTAEGIQKLRDELTYLKKALPEHIAETQRTAAFGDRSDSAEYKDAKGRLRRTNWRILELHDELKRVTLIEPGKNASGTIQLGSTVMLGINGAQKTFQIVGPQETNPTEGRISHLSPLGAALIGHAKGDTVIVNPPKGIGRAPQTYRILEIK